MNFVCQRTNLLGKRTNKKLLFEMFATLLNFNRYVTHYWNTRGVWERTRERMKVVTPPYYAARDALVAALTGLQKSIQK